MVVTCPDFHQNLIEKSDVKRKQSSGQARFFFQNNGNVKLEVGWRYQESFIFPNLEVTLTKTKLRHQCFVNNHSCIFAPCSSKWFFSV
mmetsp:Transcript_9894/g.15203  ORF Transcript_9894/g.15203 Transcript_9894/m.15203 type:complete len:88 (-) Transcript_9894:287-550(-)